MVEELYILIPTNIKLREKRRKEEEFGESTPENTCKGLKRVVNP